MHTNEQTAKIVIFESQLMQWSVDYNVLSIRSLSSLLMKIACEFESRVMRGWGYICVVTTIIQP